MIDNQVLQRLMEQTCSLGQAALAQYRDGTLNHAELGALCAEIIVLENELCKAPPLEQRAATTLAAPVVELQPTVTAPDTIGETIGDGQPAQLASDEVVPPSLEEGVESERAKLIVEQAEMLVIEQQADSNQLAAPQSCPTCGATTRAGARFCTSCGLDLQQVDVTEIVGVNSAETVTQYCNACGLGIGATVTTCPNCGSTAIS